MYNCYKNDHLVHVFVTEGWVEVKIISLPIRWEAQQLQKVQMCKKDLVQSTSKTKFTWFCKYYFHKHIFQKISPNWLYKESLHLFIHATKYFHKSIVKYCSIYISECKRQKNCQITLMYNELCPILRQRHNVIKVPFNHRNSVWQLWNNSMGYIYIVQLLA